jgi:hypothetical protein
MEMKRIKFTHWQDENREIVEVGSLPPSLNNPQSEKYVLRTPHGDFIDIIKKTVVEIEDVK